MIMHIMYKLLRPRYLTRKIGYKGKTITVELADSLAKKMFGLMFRESLGNEEGMLFTLGRESRSEASIWMLNMKFSIDIVWLDCGGRVVDIEENAKPCNSIWRCESFIPHTKAKYVLELKAGAANKLGIGIGKNISL